MCNYNTYGYIYCITNRKNNKKYIGLTTRNVNTRFEEHCKADSYIGNAIRKYGPDNFCLEILDTAKCQEELANKEIEWIAKEGTFGKGYNMTNGGDGTDTSVYIDVVLTDVQKKYCEFVERSNKNDIDVLDREAMINMALSNIYYLYLTCNKEKNKKEIAQTILKLKRCYIEPFLQKKIIEADDLKKYIS